VLRGELLAEARHDADCLDGHQRGLVHVGHLQAGSTAGQVRDDCCSGGAVEVQQRRIS
jgi:hypothetical protein